MIQKVSPYFCFLPLLISAILMSCTPLPLSIIEPAEGEVFGFNALIPLTTQDAVQSSIHWEDGSGSMLGTGSSVRVILFPGTYTIKVFKDGVFQDSRSITILPPVIEAGSFYEQVHTKEEETLPLPEGMYDASFINVSSLPLSVEYSSSVTGKSALQKAEDESTDMGDIRLAVKESFYASNSRRAIPSSFSTQPALAYEKGQQKEFYVPDITGSSSDPSIITVELYGTSTDALLWIDVNASISAEDKALLWKSADAVIMRSKTLWGGWGPTASDSHIHILVTPKLNEYNIAVGFFNPYDLFPKQTDKNYPFYNPYSNECNLVTLAMPSSSSSSFSLSSICATVSHELSHLIRYQRKSRQAILAGDANPPVEKLFLDEGLAHLAETLCGYGISGGNILFAQKYLNTSYAYSFSGVNIYGMEDSTGRRGAMLLLLSFLFWDKGGLQLHEDGSITDAGGCAFLQSLVQTSKTGWDALESSIGQSKKDVLRTWLRNTMTQSKGAYIIDPFTNEPLGISAFFGPYIYTDGSSIELSGLTPCNPDEQLRCASESVFYYSSLTVTEFPKIHISSNSAESEKYLGSFFSMWLKK